MNGFWLLFWLAVGAAVWIVIGLVVLAAAGSGHHPTSSLAQIAMTA